MSNKRLHLLLLIVISLQLYASALYSSGSSVVQLTESNFKSKLKGSGLWLVEFYAPWCGHCKALAPEWEKAANALKGIVGIAALDADEHKSIGSEYGIKGFPTIKLFYTDESGKLKTSDYQGQRTAKDIVSFALEKAKSLVMKRLGEKPSKSQGSSGSDSKDNGSLDQFYSGTDVTTLTESNFESKVIESEEPWFVEFYAPWCGHCKNLKPEWIKSAKELKGKVNVGAVDCTAHQSVCTQYSVKGYPSIKFFGSNKRKPEDYQSGRDASSIVQFGLARYSVNIPPPEVKELISQDVFDEVCSPSKTLCFIAFLPDILDSKAAGRNRYIDILKSLAEAYKDRPFSYSWVQGAIHSDLEQNFGVGGFGYPALVAMNPKDKKYSVARSAFELAHLKEFVENIRRGGEAVFVVKGDLATVSSITPWDGNDAEEIADDEFSLEDLLSEE